MSANIKMTRNCTLLDGTRLRKGQVLPTVEEHNGPLDSAGKPRWCSINIDGLRFVLFSPVYKKAG